MSEWPAPQPGETPQPLAGFDSLHRVEGAALVLLCSTDIEVCSSLPCSHYGWAGRLREVK